MRENYLFSRGAGPANLFIRRRFNCTDGTFCLRYPAPTRVRRVLQINLLGAKINRDAPTVFVIFRGIYFPRPIE